MATGIRDYFLETTTVNFNPLTYVADMAADLKLSIGFVILMLAFIYLPQLNGTILRPVFGLAMILFVPGYALIAALFPGNKGINGIERALLSFGLSISVVPFIGLALNYTPWGVRLDPTVVCLTIFTLACVLIANKRRHDMPQEERFYIGISKNVVNDIFANKDLISNALTIMVIITILLSVFMVAFIIMIPTQGEKYTELYILGLDGKAENYPKDFVLGDQMPVIVGVTNHERHNMTYDLIISLNNSTQGMQSTNHTNGTNVSRLYSERVTLMDGQTCIIKTYLEPDMVGTDMKINFSLYANGNMTSPYKECYLWVNVEPPGSYPMVTPTITPTPMPTITPTPMPTIYPNKYNFRKYEF